MRAWWPPGTGSGTHPGGEDMRGRTSEALAARTRRGHVHGQARHALPARTAPPSRWSAVHRPVAWPKMAALPGTGRGRQNCRSGWRPAWTPGVGLRVPPARAPQPTGHVPDARRPRFACTPDTQQLRSCVTEEGAAKYTVSLGSPPCVCSRWLSAVAAARQSAQDGSRCDRGAKLSSNCAAGRRDAADPTAQLQNDGRRDRAAPGTAASCHRARQGNAKTNCTRARRRPATGGETLVLLLPQRQRPHEQPHRPGSHKSGAPS